MAIGTPIVFTPSNSGLITTPLSITVPTGVGSTDLCVFVVNFDVSATVTCSYTTSGSGTLTQIFGNLEGTSAMGFVFVGSGFVATDTVTFTPSTANRTVIHGIAYPGASYELVGGTAGATSTTVANSPAVTSLVNGDVALAVSFAVATTTGKTFSSITAGWTQKAFIQGGSGTRWQMAQISEKAMPTAGSTGAFVATASAAVLSSTGIQLVITPTAPANTASGSIDLSASANGTAGATASPALSLSATASGNAVTPFRGWGVAL